MGMDLQGQDGCTLKSYHNQSEPFVLVIWPQANLLPLTFSKKQNPFPEALQTDRISW